jgi:hypothetical protein
MIKEFKIGNWYKWKGEKNRLKKMLEKLENGKWYRCIEVDDYYGANFEGVKKPYTGTWNWENVINNFEEISRKEIIKKLLKLK